MSSAIPSRIRHGLYFLAWTAVLLLTGLSPARADVATDGTLGPARILDGPDFLIPEGLGRTAGGNLFHSFERFSVFQGQRATFTGPPTIENVISRVTGGDPSTIDGILRSQVGSADFFFINPAGVVFGPRAQVDVPSAFHAGTAQEVRFDDGSVFGAVDPGASTLSVSEPASFGYLGPRPADVVLEGSRLGFAPGSTVSLVGGGVTLAGTATQQAEVISRDGEIRITAAGQGGTEVPLDGSPTPAMAGAVRLEQARVDTSGPGGGRISMASGALEIEAATLSANNLGEAAPSGGIDLTVSGPMHVGPESRVESNAFGTGDAGGIRVRTGSLRILGGDGGSFPGLFSEVEPGAEGSSGGLDLTVGADLSIEGPAGINAGTWGHGDAGPIRIEANTVTVDGQGRATPYRGSDFIAGIDSEADTEAFGNAGQIAVAVSGRLSLLNAASLSASTHGAGNAGSIEISARELVLDGASAGSPTGIYAVASAPAAGRGGEIRIRAGEDVQVIHGASIAGFTTSGQDAGAIDMAAGGELTVSHGGWITSDTYGGGHAGSVRIDAGAVTLDGEGGDAFTGISSDANAGAGGDSGSVEITTEGRLTVVDGAVIASDTYSTGDGGGVVIRAGEIRIDGEDGDLFTGIASDAKPDSRGNGGSVEITVDGHMALVNGAVITSDTYSAGDGGGVAVQADGISIDNGGEAGQQTGITSVAHTDSLGAAGSVDVGVDTFLEMTGGGEISSSTSGRGDAGTVIVRSGALRIRGGENDVATRIASTADGGSMGTAGQVEVAVDGPLEVLGGAEITSSTFGGGDAGSVRIRTGALTIDGQGAADRFTGIASVANPGSMGDAGSVDITVDGLLEMVDGVEIASDTWSQGAAGGVRIEAGRLRIDDRGVDGQFTGISSAALSGSTGDAGSVHVTVHGLLELVDGAVIASSTASLGNAGSVRIEAREVLLDGTGLETQRTGISTLASSGSQGRAGSVSVSVDGPMTLAGGAEIASSTFGPGDAGTVNIAVGGLLRLINGGKIVSDTGAGGSAGGVIVRAGRIFMDDRGVSGQFTHISSTADTGSTGRAGTVDVAVEGLLELVLGAEIASDTYSSGDAGGVRIEAGELRIDDRGLDGQFTGISSVAVADSSGDAGSVEVSVDGLLSLINGGKISSSTFAEGNAGGVRVRAGEIRIDDLGTHGQTTAIESIAGSDAAGDAGTVDVTVHGLLELLRGGIILSDTNSLGNAGGVKVEAGRLVIDGRNDPDQFTGISSDANRGSRGHAGSVAVAVVGRLDVIGGGEISSSTYAVGDAGSVVIRSGQLSIDDSGAPGGSTAVSSVAKAGAEGDAGSVDVTVDGLLALIDGGNISSSTFSAGDAGSVVIRAGELTIDDRNTEGQTTTISSIAETDSQGDAGTVEISVDGLLELVNGGEISSSTFARGDAGQVIVQAGELTIDNANLEGQFTRITSDAYSGSEGDAGSVDVTVGGHLSVIRGAHISSGTYALGHGGDVTIRSGSAAVEGAEGLVTGVYSQANAGSAGDAGSVDVSVDGLLALTQGGVISSGTFSLGKGGGVTVRAGDLTIDDRNLADQFTGISSQANEGFGDAGFVDITVGNVLTMLDGGQISSSTFSFGNAGDVTVSAREVRIDNGNHETDLTGIISLADWWSLGYVGGVAVSAESVQIRNGGEVSIAARQELFEEQPTGIPESNLLITADRIHLDADSRITAESAYNVPAAAVQVRAGRIILADRSRITTSANDADGGPITVEGEALILKDGLITTSVEGLSGDGGNIILGGSGNAPAGVLVLDGGFIQANTAADGARGGDIFIDARAVVGEGGRLAVGGTERRLFEAGQGTNVIQAAAPGGEQGAIAITAPDLDISGALVNLVTGFAQPVRLATDPCAADADRTSSMVRCGRGGLPSDPTTPSAVRLGGDRLHRLLPEAENGSPPPSSGKKRQPDDPPTDFPETRSPGGIPQ